MKNVEPATAQGLSRSPEPAQAPLRHSNTAPAENNLGGGDTNTQKARRELRHSADRRLVPERSALHSLPCNALRVWIALSSAPESRNDRAAISKLAGISVRTLSRAMQPLVARGIVRRVAGQYLLVENLWKFCESANREGQNCPSRGTELSSGRDKTVPRAGRALRNIYISSTSTTGGEDLPPPKIPAKQETAKGNRHARAWLEITRYTKALADHQVGRGPAPDDAPRLAREQAEALEVLGGYYALLRLPIERWAYRRMDFIKICAEHEFDWEQETQRKERKAVNR